MIKRLSGMVRGAAMGWRATAVAPSAFPAGSTRGVVGSTWNATASGPNRIGYSENSTLLKRTRDIDRRDPFCAQGVATLANFVVGDGINPAPPTGDAFKSLLSLWRDWSVAVDPMGRHDIHGLARLAMQTTAGAGECFARLRPRRMTDGLPVPLQVQLLEPEFCPYQGAFKGRGRNRVVNGVEFDALDRVQAYHMYKAHPKDSVNWSRVSDMTEIARVPSALVLHTVYQHRPGQVRGFSPLARVLQSINDLLDYQEAEIVRKQATSRITGTIKSPSASAAAEFFMAEQTDPAVSSGYDPALGIHVGVDPGTLLNLPPGYDAQFLQPPDTGSNFSPFMRWQWLQIAMALGVPYEYFTGDLQGANERAMRVADIRFKKVVSNWRSSLQRQFLSGIWSAFVTQAYISGAWRASESEYRAALSGTRWITPPWEQIRPIEDVRAQAEKIRAGFGTQRDAVMAAGHDWDDWLDARADEIEQMRARGIITDTDPYMTKSGSANVDTTEVGIDE